MNPDLPRRLLLVDVNAAVVEAWREAFAGEPGVEIVEGPFEKLPEFDAIVSPANSFGLMDGGIDLALSRFFGWDLMDAVQARIRAEFFGEQPIGTAIVVPTGDDVHPFLVHAPTMRVPTDIRGTDYAYLAMLAVLRAVRDHNRSGARRITSLACSGLGTATGKLEPRVAAAQMVLAWRIAHEPDPQCNWIVAKHRRDSVAATLSAEERFTRPPPRVIR